MPWQGALLKRSLSRSPPTGAPFASRNQATKKGRIAPPLFPVRNPASPLGLALLEDPVFLVADEAELGDARTLDDVEHLGRQVVAGIGFRLELQLGLDGKRQRLLQIGDQRVRADRGAVPQNLV